MTRSIEDILRDARSAMKELADRISEVNSTRDRFEVSIDLVELEEIARVIRNTMDGVVCKRCAGAGSRAYSSTATWHGGVGGQQITNGVCDACWGTGRTDRHGPNLRRLMRD